MPTQIMSTGRSSEYLDPNAPAGIAHNLYAEATLSDTTAVNPDLIYDGASVTEISVPSGKFVITDLMISLGFVYWTIQLDKGDGNGYQPLAIFGFTLIGAVTEVKTFKTPITIQGGTGVKIRLEAQLTTTPTTPVDVNMTLRCYTDGGAPTFSTKTPTVFTLTGLATTGATEEVMDISANAATPASTFAVSAGTTLQVTDFDVAADGGLTIFKLQYTTNGTDWFTAAGLDVTGLGTSSWVKANPATPWWITGGANVAIRITATTPDGAIPVTGVLMGLLCS